MKKKGRKRINLAEHDPSERVLFARANIRGRNSEPPWIPSVPTFSLLSSFHSYPFTLFSPLPPPLPSFALENEISCSIAIHAHRVPTQFSFIECGSDVERGSRVRMFASLNRPTSMTSRNPSSASVD